MIIHCKICQSDFEFSNEEKILIEAIAVEFDGKKIEFGLPKLCPDCRQCARLRFRNEKTLYKRKCDYCAEGIVSIYHDKVSFPVYCTNCFWGDSWDPLTLGRDVDFNRPFLEQFKDLLQVVPRLAIINKQSQNSEYCNYSYSNKNCYLTFGNHYEEDCMYGRYSTKNRDCLDYFWLYGSEKSYECMYCKNCYCSVFLDHCQNCSECYFSSDLIGCKNCLFSCGLRNKQYYIFNEPHTKESFVQYFKNLHLGSHVQFQKMIVGWQKFRTEQGFFRSVYQINCENCRGDILENCKNVQNCFSCTNCRDCLYGYQMDETFNSIDNSHLGYDRCELTYNTIGCSGIYHCISCDSCWHDSDLYYCNLCFSSKDSFGCVGLKHHQYCVLNKQYSSQEYQKLALKIAESMGEGFGDFFVEASPFAYNETVALEYYPMNREEVLAKGWRWRDIETKLSGKKNYQIPDDIKDVGPEVLQAVFVCAKSGRQYKIMPKELAFYKKLNVPLPRICPDSRIDVRNQFRNPNHLFKRKCGHCSREMDSSFRPNSIEKAYCDDCYSSILN